MSDLPPQAAGPIVAALIAATLAFLGLIITKEQKTSEFRQAWIDALRDDVAELLARAHVISDAYITGVIGEDSQDWKAVRDDLVAANNASVRIRLRLNPNEDASRKVFLTLDAIDEEFSKEDPPDPVALRELSKRLIDESKSILKTEWNRVRRGEPVFVGAKILAGIAIIGALAAAAVLANDQKTAAKQSRVEGAPAR